MKLNFETIRAVTCGAVRFAEEDGGIRFYRFTEEQEELYKPYRAVTDSYYHQKTFGGSNIRLVFRTDSKTLGLEISVREATTRSFFDLEVFADGKCVGNLNNHKDIPFPAGDPKIACPYGDFSGEFSLGEGEKRVEIFLPWSVTTALKSLKLEDGSFVTPVKRPKKLLIFGDSITQGYDIHKFSLHYTNRLAEMLNADPVSKAIGGEIFFPPLAEAKDDLNPDYITVAYGTNDFSKTDGSTFVADCRAFYASLRKHYPAAKIFAITPIWRKDRDKMPPFGSFDSVEEKIREAVAEIPGVTVIRGYEFVPQDTSLFSDLRLHPNDEGFAHYGDHLLEAIAPHIAD